MRRKLARWLVGHYVTLPDREGVWVVEQLGGGLTVTFEADRLSVPVDTVTPPASQSVTDTK